MGLRHAVITSVDRDDLPDFGAYIFAETIRQIKNAGEWPPAGLDYHVCFGSDSNLKVSEIWNSREQFEAFGKRLMPILAGVGIQFANPPDIFEVHNIVKG